MSAWGPAVAGRLRLVLDDEPQLSEHRHGAVLPALEIAGGEALARREFICGAQNGFRRVTACVPDQVISRRGAETMRREERLRPQLVVLLYRAQYVISGHM